MYLKEIKAYGFKSFADKTNIELGSNINGIVGPNGTGKSNIVDAVKWVLGEQSMKSLRGESSNDIIFSGSLSRKPLNSASVTLVFDNSDRVLPIDFNEVAIKRVVFRTGENEYYINNSKCRLKDINDLLMETGSAKESFNIIEQGKIDAILSTKPIERRPIFEEAAGVLKYKKRKEEALRKLDRTSQNINRVNDIISELNVNLEPLRIQSIKAKEYKKLKDELKNIEVSLITHDIDYINNIYQKNKNRIDELNDELTMLSSSNSNYDLSLLKEKEVLRNVNESISKKNMDILSLTKEVEKIDADIRLLKEREKYKDETDKIESNIISIKEKIYKLNNNISIIDNDIEVNNKIISDYNNKINELEVVYNNNLNNKNKIYNEINKNNKLKLELVNKIEILENNINNNSSIPNSVKSILSNPKFTKVHNTIGNLIEVEDKYSQAISISLLGSANYIVVEDTSCVKEMLYYLKENNIGRATFFPLDVIKPRSIDFNTLSILSNTDGYVGIASSLVKYDKMYDNIILNQLGNVIVVTNIDVANVLSKRIDHKYKIVTLDGQVVNVGGSITGGKQVKENNVISLKYELDKNKYELDNINKKLKLLDSEFNNINNVTISNNNELSNYRVKINEISLLINNKNSIKSNYLSELNNLDRELSDLNNITNKKSEIEILLDNYYKKKEELDNLNKELDILKLDKIKYEESIKETEDTLNSANGNINKKEKELNNLNIEVNRMDVKLDNLLNKLSSDYNITFEYAKEYFKLEIDDEDARKEVNSLKNRINSIGEVNLGSIEEYDRVNTRYEFLTNQKNDLLNAKDTLNEIINEMDNIMENKFYETFKLIKVEFAKVFRELFKGGKAELILTDPDDLLNTGIEIKAEPPGKKLQSITLLSGGEKTFTAISLLFAILNVRPVPFCIFDEVEAALDDANVENFGKYLDTYRDKTQFILITHKKKTMEFADILYGVTMQESGVSKLVSVRLEDIKK